jgi:hypothetical protein
VAVIFLTLITLKSKFSRLLEISYAGLSGEKVTGYCLDRLFGIWGEVRILQIFFSRQDFMAEWPAIPL